MYTKRHLYLNKPLGKEGEFSVIYMTVYSTRDT